MTTKTKPLRPFTPIVPGDILREELDACGWTQAEFAEIIGKPVQTVSEIATGKKSITPATAVLFSEALGLSAEFWLNLESSYRLDLLAKEQSGKNEFVERKARLFNAAPISEMLKLQWISCDKRRGRYTEKHIDQIEGELLKFYNVSSLTEIQPLNAQFRKSSKVESLESSFQAWINRAKLEASKVKVRSYARGDLKDQVETLAKLSMDGASFSSIQKELGKFGVRLTHIPHLSRTKLDGAAFWLDEESPVVAVTIRINRIDNFWFTLMHELAHVLFHRGAKSKPMLDEDIIEPVSDKKEQEADGYAQDWLIAPEEFENYQTERTNRYSAQSVRKFAEEISVHPAIIVGRLQHEEKIHYSYMRNVLERFH